MVATGSDAGLPPYVSPERAKAVKGIFVYRSIADLDAIITYADQEGVKGGHATVVGGGLLGLEAVSQAQLYAAKVEVVCSFLHG